jgi:hypothetical protein
MVMNENTQIRNKAWQLLWNKKWFWKLFGAYLLLNLVTQATVTIINGILTKMGICNIDSLSKSGVSPQFSSGMIIELVSSTFLFLFICLIMSSISLYGNDKILNRAADDNQQNWMKAAFSGFKIPLNLAWLGFRLMLVYITYLLPAFLIFGIGIAFFEDSIVSKIVTEESITFSKFTLFFCAWLIIYLALFCIPFYKYRYLFRIKADNPDWSARKCFSYCRAITSGEKMRMFKHDCSYWKIFLIPLTACFALMALCGSITYYQEHFNIHSITGTICIIASALTMITAYLIIAASSLVCVFYNGIGQSLLYRKISSEKTITENGVHTSSEM